MSQDLYGPSTNADQPAANGATNGVNDSVKKRIVVHLSICDALPAHGPISDMAFGIARNGVRSFFLLRSVPTDISAGSTGS